MEGHLVFKICTHCGGDGLSDRWNADNEGQGSVGQGPCTICNGTGYILWGYMTKDNYTIPDDLPIPDNPPIPE